MITLIFSLVFGIYQILGKLINMTSEKLLKIMKQNLTFPDREEQDEIVKIMEVIDRERDQIHHRIAKDDINNKKDRAGKGASWNNQSDKKKKASKNSKKDKKDKVIPPQHIQIEHVPPN